MDNRYNYRGILIAFMSYKDNIAYDATQVSTQEHLTEVTAKDVVDWFNLKAFGTDVPTSALRPIHARSNSLKHWKKA